MATQLVEVEVKVGLTIVVVNLIEEDVGEENEIRVEI